MKHFHLNRRLKGSLIFPNRVNKKIQEIKHRYNDVSLSTRANIGQVVNYYINQRYKDTF